MFYQIQSFILKSFILGLQKISEICFRCRRLRPRLGVDTRTMPDQKRKSSLTVSVSVESLISENYEISWPEISMSEVAPKCPRRDSDSSSPSPLKLDEVKFDESKLDQSKFLAQPSNTTKTNEVDNLILFSSSHLLKSSSFCNPILKEDLGFESWRDYL
jgi:hypothetical protein